MAERHAAALGFFVFEALLRFRDRSLALDACLVEIEGCERALRFVDRVSARGVCGEGSRSRATEARPNGCILHKFRGTRRERMTVEFRDEKLPCQAARTTAFLLAQSVCTGESVAKFGSFLRERLKRVVGRG